MASACQSVPGVERVRSGPIHSRWTARPQSPGETQLRLRPGPSRRSALQLPGRPLRRASRLREGRHGAVGGVAGAGPHQPGAGDHRRRPSTGPTGAAGTAGRLVQGMAATPRGPAVDATVPRARASVGGLRRTTDGRARGPGGGPAGAWLSGWRQRRAPGAAWCRVAGHAWCPGGMGARAERIGGWRLGGRGRCAGSSALRGALYGADRGSATRGGLPNSQRVEMTVQLTARADTPLQSRSRVRIVVVFVFAVIPLTFVGSRALGFQLSGWAWLLILAAAAPVVLTEPLHERAVRLLLPYLLFLVYAAVSLAWTDSFNDGVASLVQLIVPVLAYLVAWRIPDSTAVQERLRSIALRGLGIAVLLTILFLAGLHLRL